MFKSFTLKLIYLPYFMPNNLCGDRVPVVKDHKKKRWIAVYCGEFHTH